MKMDCHSSGNHLEIMAQQFKKTFYVSLFLTIPILILSFNWVPTSLVPNHNLAIANGFFATIIYLYGGWPFITGALSEIKHGTIGMMTLVAMAISIAYGYSMAVLFGLPGDLFFWELATLIDIMLIGHFIEMKATSKAFSSLTKLLTFLPQKATLKHGDTLTTIATNNLKPNDIIIVRPGEKIPVDGTIIEGQSTIDQSALTGESLPLEVSPGQTVLAGSINSAGILTIRINKLATESYFAHVIKLAQQAAHVKTNLQRLADKAAGVLTITAITAGVITFVVWYNYATISFALERMVTVMIITCPHALGLAIPLVVSVIISKATQQGFIIKNIKAFEQAQHISTIIFDKTGTLTEGKLTTTDIIPLTNITEKELITYAASLEQQAEHPISKALLQLAQERNINLLPVSPQTIKVEGGIGITGIVNTKTVTLGNKNVIPKHQHDNVSMRKQLTLIEHAGKSPLFVIIDNEIQGIIGFKDVVRKEARQAITLLHEKGIKTLMVTGDNNFVANHIALELGIPENHVHAQSLPAEKIAIIKKIQEEQKKTVMMIGDGINDAPSLAQANISVAMHSGTDITQASADIVLKANNLLLIPEIIDDSKIMYKKMLQNLMWATGYNIISLPIAAGILAPWNLYLNPAAGAILMTASTIIVAANAVNLRLKQKKN